MSPAQREETLRIDARGEGPDDGAGDVGDDVAVGGDAPAHASPGVGGDQRCGEYGHRVVGADGSLTGYAGGLAVKRALLDHEAADAMLFV